MTSEAKIFWWLDKKPDMENKVRNCTAFLTSGKNLQYQLQKKQFGKLGRLSQPGQEIRIDLTGKLHNKNLYGEVKILIAVDRFSKWPTVKLVNFRKPKK